MPRSAIDAAWRRSRTVEELPARSSAYFRHAPYIAHPDAPVKEKTQSALDKVFVLLRTHTGNDFSLLQEQHHPSPRRAADGAPQLNKLDRLHSLPTREPSETELLLKELLIGVTSFFRDPAAWEQLKNQVMPSF